MSTLCSRCSEAKGNYLTPTGLLPLLLAFLSAHLQTSSSSFPVYNLGSSPRQKQQQERRRKKKNRKREEEEEEEERMGSKVLRAESVLRILSLVFAAMAALLVGLDTQTKTVFFVTRTATVKDMDALWVMTVVFSVVAGYHLLHLFRCMAFTWLGKNPCHCNKFVAWLYFVLDQGSTYATFGATMAALQAALVGLFGIGSLQWSKLCNIYTRFCDQIAGGIICGLVATLVMAVVSAISAHRLFQLYPRTRRSSPKSAGGGRQWLLF